MKGEILKKKIKCLINASKPARAGHSFPVISIIKQMIRTFVLDKLLDKVKGYHKDFFLKETP